MADKFLPTDTDERFIKIGSTCYQNAGVSLTNPDSTLDSEANSCIECTSDPDDGTCDHCASLVLEVTGFTSATCGSCNCTELNNVYVLGYDASCVWLGYNDGIAVQITKGATWVLTLHCESTANPACATFTQAIDGNCPLPEPWTLVASTCSGGGVGGIVYNPFDPDPDGTPCTIGTCCSHYDIAVSGFTSSSLCGPNCNCGDYNTTYDFFRSGDEWVSANITNKISGIMQCIDSVWYVTLACGISINPVRPTMGSYCVQFTAPDVDGCPPTDSSWTLDATFPGCNDSDGVGASITVSEDSVLCATSIEYEECDTPANKIYVDPDILSTLIPPPPTVEISGTCYQFSEASNTAVDVFSIDSEPVDCDAVACASFPPNMKAVFCCVGGGEIGYTDDTIGNGTWADNDNSWCFTVTGAAPTSGNYFDYTLVDIVGIAFCGDPFGPSYCVDACGSY